MSSPNQLSFLPDDYLERKSQRRTNVICALLFIIVMGAIGSAFWFTERSMREIEQQNALVEQEYTEAARNIEQVQQMQDKQRKMAHQAELTASLLEKVPRSFLLAEITNSMPGGVSLLDFNMESKRRVVNPAPTKTAFEQKKAEVEAKNSNAGASTPPPPQVTVYDVQMKLTGVATTDVQVAQFISKLNQSRLLTDVNLVISDEFVQENEKLRKFQIEMTLSPDAEVQPTTQPTHTAAVDLNEEAK